MDTSQLNEEEKRRLDPELNYYLILGLDFNKPELDVAVIDKAVGAKKNECSKVANTPGKGIRANQILESLKYFDNIKTNPDALRAEAQAAQKIAANKVNAFIGALKTLSDKKISEDALKKFVEENKELRVELKDLTNVVSRAGITVEKKAAASGADPKLAQIEQWLSVIRKDNLFDYLYTIVDDPANKIRKADNTKYSRADIENLAPAETGKICDQIYSIYQKKPATVQRNTAIKELATLAKDKLGDPASKQAYINYLKESVLPSKVQDMLDICRLTGKINKTQGEDLVRLFLESPEGRNLSTARASDIIKQAAKKAGITEIVLPDESDGGSSIRRCKLCGGIAGDSKATHCPMCGEPFFIKCINPKCNADVENGSKNCSKCGTDLAGKTKADLEIQTARKSLAVFDFASAKASILKAKNHWAAHPDIKALEAEITRLEGEIGEKAKQIDEFVNKKLLTQAKAEFDALTRRVSGYSNPSLKARIDAGIQEANTWLSKAKASGSNEGQLIEYASKALEVCADLQEARSIMVKYPPKSASGLSIVQRNGSNVVSWIKSPSDGNVSYKVLRGEGIIPKEDAIGGKVKLVTETSMTQFADNAVPANVPLYYAVYTYRTGISAAPIYNEKPVFFYAEVSNLTLTEGNECINLTWEAPAGVTSIEVFRKEGAQINSYGDGTKLPVTGNNLISDTGLKNEQVYYYKVFANYNSLGNIVHSDGVAVSGKPSMPPEKVANVNVAKQNSDTYRLTWTPPARGDVQIMCSKNPSRFKGGDTATLSQLGSVLTPLQVISKGRDYAEFKLAGDGVTYIFAINVVGQMGVVSDSVRVATASDFSNLRELRVSGNVLHIQFDWTINAPTAVIMCKTSGYPTGPDDAAAEKLVVTKASYTQAREVQINNIGNCDYYVTVYASYGNGVYSSGISGKLSNAEPGIVSFNISPDKGFMGFGAAKGIKVTLESSNGTIPEIEVYKKVGVQPLSRGDGVLVGTIPACQTARNTVSLPDNYRDNNKYMLFFTDDSLYKNIQLRRR